MILANTNGQTKLLTKGRLINSSEKILSFENGKYTERTGAGAEYEDKAPIQALVLRELERKASTVTELVERLNKDKGQISNICKALAAGGKIQRANRNAAWHLIELAN